MRTLAIVDPYDAGAMLAPAFAEHGVVSVMVPSTPEIPRDHAAAFEAASYGRVLPWSADVADTVAALRGLDVARVLAGSERGVELADHLSEALALPGNGTRLSAARRDKFCMIEEVGRHEIRVPRQFQSDRLDAIQSWIDEGGHWPAVLKPRQAQGSEGVRLCESTQTVARAFQAIHGQTNRFGFRNETVLVQEFLPGREYVVDTVSHDGHHRLAALWVYGKPPPGYEQVGQISTKELLPVEGPFAERMFAFAARVLDALGIRYGAGHCEVMVDDKGPALIEIGARLHGGPPAHQMNRAATGTSQLDLLVQSCVDPAGFLAGGSPSYVLTGGASMALLRDASLRGEIERLPSAQRVVWSAPGGPPSRFAGLVTLIHPERSVVAADLEIVTGGIACEILTSREKIEAVAADWGALLARSRCNRAFGGPSWYLAALEAHPELSPSVVVASRAGCLAGVLPLAWDDVSNAARFATVLSDYNDLVVADGDMAAARRLMIFARARFPNLELSCVRADSDCASAEARAASFGEKKYPCPFADLSHGYDSWLASRHPNFRRQLGQVARRAERGHVRVDRLDPGQEQGAKLARFFLEMQHERFGERSVFLRDPAAKAFLEAALPRLFREGRALVFGLSAQGQRIGVNICMLGANSLGYWNAGFRSGYLGFSPGTLMLHAALREACALGLAEFDLLRGREAYKQKWRTGEREIGRLM
jgi:biotin carboxylase/CelD/BcsL family acetyltransferase involved in cellulose biosynthesis